MARMAFDRELNDLQREILRMGSMVEEAIHLAVKSLAERNVELANQIFDNDDRIDRLEDEIEERCLKLIALQQPLASDLRIIDTVLKIVTDLERMADEATNICEITRRIAHEPLLKPLVDIPRMADMAQQMAKDSLDAFVNRDVELAKRTCEADDAVDKLYADLYEELVGFAINGKDPYTVNQSINLLFVARHLERIADHATNVGERVVYMVTGDRSFSHS